jgi:hypothetical protein
MHGFFRRNNLGYFNNGKPPKESNRQIGKNSPQSGHPA